MVTVLRETNRTVSLIGAANSLGTSFPGCAGAPAALRAAGIERRIGGSAAGWSGMIDAAPAAGGNIARALADFSGALADHVEQVARSGARFAVIGGDHSSAIGAWSGAARAQRGQGPLGLIWIDAHLDSHTPETTPSGQYHGMPVACLLGHGDAPLAGLAGGRPAIAPGHLCIVGARSFEWQEPELLNALGVKIFEMAEIRARGLSAVMDEAVVIAGAGTAGIGVSIDLDVLDPREAPAVGSAVPGGLGVAELAAALAPLAPSHSLIGCEIAEFNPELDGAAETAAAVETLLAAMLGGA